MAADNPLKFVHLSFFDLNRMIPAQFKPNKNDKSGNMNPYRHLSQAVMAARLQKPSDSRELKTILSAKLG
ncbi:hypothetical protein [Methylomicrobium agile]|uniref:hypothetical protein n=1 Tax=Methylomicrobium agile TaxID=39774 RepID=UPI001470575B|nr:hypothetical protein [Methylomicrobium agile]